MCESKNIKLGYEKEHDGFWFFFYRTNVTLSVTSCVTIKLTRTDLAVLDEIKENPKQTRDEIAIKIGKTVRTVQRSIDKLKQCNKITRIGNKNYGYWEVLEN